MKGIKKLGLLLSPAFILSSCGLVPKSSTTLSVTGISAKLYKYYSSYENITLEPIDNVYYTSINHTYYLQLDYKYNLPDAAAPKLIGDKATFSCDSVVSINYYSHANDLCLYQITFLSRSKTDVLVTVDDYSLNLSFDSADEEFSLSSLYPWIDNMDNNVNSVGVVSYVGSISPTFNTFNTHYKSSSSDDILKAKEALKNGKVFLIKDDFDFEVSGIGSLIYNVEISGVTYSINVFNNVTTKDGFNYEITTPMYSVSEVYGYSFLWQSVFNIEFYVDDKITETNFDLNDLIFREINEDSVTKDDRFDDMEFRNDVGEIEILNDKVFHIDTEFSEKTYEILNDFSFIPLLSL